jgi:Leucine-rich repeat (LRR) protein
MDLNLGTDQEKIIEIYASNNQIQTIDFEMFRVVSNLTLIDLSFNRIDFISKLAFVAQGNLKRLLLGNNNISVLCDDTFNNLFELVELQLQNNQLTVLEKSIFSKNLNLKVLYLHNNRIISIEVETFAGLRKPDNRTLTLHGNLCDSHGGIGNCYKLFQDVFKGYQNEKYKFCSIEKTVDRSEKAKGKHLMALFFMLGIGFVILFSVFGILLLNRKSG